MGAVVAGGTGLVGSALLDELAARRVETLAVTRRTGQPRIGLLWKCTSLADLRPDDIPPGTTAAFCALGTTIKNVGGSQEEFRRVDHELVLAYAAACRGAGVPVFVAVSAAGADPGSKVFYNRVKGETERDLQALGFPSLALLRPGLLLGDRAEKRTLERGLVGFTRAVRPLLPGVLRGADVGDVARAMVEVANEGRAGVRVVGNAEIARLGSLGAAPRATA